MKLTTLLMLVCCLQISAKSVSQNVTLKFRNASLTKVFNEIKKQTGYTFIYTESMIRNSKKVTLEVKNTPLQRVLKQCFISQPFSYRIINKTIILEAQTIEAIPINNNRFESAAIDSNLSLPPPIVVKGLVTDSVGNPLVGATVLVKGSNQGVQTDSNGAFDIEVDLGAILTISFVGYETKEIKVQDQASLVIQLKRVVSTASEVLIEIGYGNTPTEEITSAITYMTPEDFNKGNVYNSAQLLQGKIPGLSIVGPQGNPNGDYYLRLRGLSTLGANSQPLVVVDGVIGVDLKNVDPNDIASVSVLKDGGAASIYGTRGSSGVILISTKNGAVGKPQVTYNSYAAIESVDRSLPAMDRKTYLANVGTDFGSNTNWLEKISRNAISHAHHLSLSGGSDRTKYMASLNYRNIQGVLKGSGFQQLGGRLNLIHKAINNKLTITLNIANNTKDEELGFDDAFRAAVAMPPTAPIYSSEDDFLKYGGYFQSEVHELYNPVGIIKQNINDRKRVDQLYNLKAEYKILSNLSGAIHYSRTNEKEETGRYISKYSYYGSGVDRNGLASRSDFSTHNNLFEGTGTYEGKFGHTKFSLLGGYSYQRFNTSDFSIQGGNFLTDAFGYNNFSASKDFADGRAVATSEREESKLIAFFGRLNINYKNAYFLTMSLRREGSSRFGKDNKWGDFPGVSAGVNLKELIAMHNINQFKIRGSYGVTGALPDRSYLSLQLYGPGSSPTYFFHNGVFTPVYSPQSNANPNLKWETKSEFNIGYDITAFDNRFDMTFDYYNRKTTDALITLNVPVPPNLFPTTVLNAGVLKSQGVELSVGYQLIRKRKIEWNVRATYASYNTKVISLSMGDIRYGVREVGGLPAPLTGNTVRVEEGKPIGQLIGWIYEGVADNGDYILKDIDNNGVINENDFDIIGRALPKGEFGLSSNLHVGRFDFNVFLRGVYGHDLINLNRTMFEQVSRISSYNLINTKYFDADYKGPAAFNSYYIENGSFLKMDNLSIGYNLPLKDNEGIQTLRLYLTGQNLFYITGYSGVDPEPRYSDDNGNVLAPGIEPRNSWVTTRTFTLGLNLSF